jgi:hypothetical protein
VAGGGLVPFTAAKAFAMFNLPPLETTPAKFDKTSTFASNVVFKAEALKPGLAALIRAAVPVTWGVAIEVPLM